MYTRSSHWDGFYNESDIIALAETGISHVRIPFGYWLVDVLPNEPFPAPATNDSYGQKFYLKRMMKWCHQAGLKVSILSRLYFCALHSFVQ